MKKIYLTTLLILTIISLTSTLKLQAQDSTQQEKTIYQIKAEFDAAHPDEESEEPENVEVENEGEKAQFNRWYNFWEPRLFPSGKFSQLNTLKNSFELSMQSAINSDWDINLGISKNSTTCNKNNAEWEIVTNENMPINQSDYGAGRINVVRIAPSNSLVMYAGSASGGLWKSIDGGDSWFRPMIKQPFICISDIAIDPHNENTIYIGTGSNILHEGNINPSYWGSLGIFKSIDGGVTFSSRIKNFGNLNCDYGEWPNIKIHRILIDPSATNILYAAISKSNGSTTEDGGIFKSIDNGNSWTQIFSGVMISDLEFKPNNSSVIYASGNGFFKTIDGGVNWQNITPSNIINCFSNSSKSFSLVAICKKSGMENYVYFYTPFTNSCTGIPSLARSLFVSDDAGQHVFQINLSALPGSFNDQGYEFHKAFDIDPADENRILFGYANLFQITISKLVDVNNSTIGFSSNNPVEIGGYDTHPVTHGDWNGLEWDSNNSNILFASNDGGIYKSINSGKLDNNTATPPMPTVCSFKYKNKGLQVAEAYGVDISKNTLTSTNLITGLQDNGCRLFNGANWIYKGNSDGSKCTMDPTNENNYTYSSTFQSGYFYFKNSSVNLPNGFVKYSENYQHQLNPLNPNELFVGYKDIWKYSSSSFGNSPLSDFSNFASQSTNICNFYLWPQGTIISSGVSGKKIYDDTKNNIKSFEVAPNNPNIIYTSFSRPVWNCENDNLYTLQTDISIFQLIKLDLSSSTPVYQDVSPSFRNNIPGFKNVISDIEIDPANSNHLWVCFTGYKDNNFNNHKVFESTNGGTSWSEITFNLPVFPCNSLKLDAATGNLFVGTDAGVFKLQPGSTSWIPFNENLPFCVITEMQIQPLERKLYVSTFGNSFWKTNLNTDWTHSFTIPQNTVYNFNTPVVNVSGFITVPFGSTLDLSSTEVRFDPTVPSGIIVERGGLLHLEDSKLTSSCKNGMWSGIQLIGSGLKRNQDIISTGDYTGGGYRCTNQGMIYSKNSIIENAHDAILTGFANFDPGENFPHFNGNAGGVVRCINTQFINNRRSVEFMKYANKDLSHPEKDNESYFTNCQFIANDFLHSNRYVDATTGSRFGTYCGISMWDVKGIKIKGCTFDLNKNNVLGNLHPALKGNAVHSIDARFNFENNMVKNAGWGIYVSSNNNPAYTLKATGNTFDNVFQGITSISMANDNISQNHFNNIPAGVNVVPFPYFPSGQTVCFGIYSVDGYSKINHNDINTSNSFQNIGLIVQDNASAASFLQDNTTQGTTYGFQGEKNNSKLETGCNEHQQHSADWVLNPLTPKGMLKNQLPTPLNKFKDVCSSTYNHINSFLINQPTYEEYTGNADGVNTLCSNNIHINRVSSAINQCPSNKLPDPNCCQGMDYINALKAQLPHAANPFEIEKIQYEIVGAYAAMMDYASAYDYLTIDIKTVEAYKQALVLALHTNNLTQCNAALDYLNAASVEPNEAIELTAFINLYTMLKDKATTDAVITDEHEQEMAALHFNTNQEQLIRAVTATTTRVSNHAKRLLELVFDEPFNPNPEWIDVSQLRMAKHTINNDSTQITTNDNNFTLYPNPGKDELTISYLLRNKTGKLLINDLVGRQVYDATLTNGIAKITIKLNVASGTYICKLVDGTDTKVKKWIVIK
ncbi:MAG: hypothetical protein RL708_45 [Bacteroidota bacterium]|jgi:hypothetical protein